MTAPRTSIVNMWQPPMSSVPSHCRAIGDAVNGHTSDGRYCSRSHGGPTEARKATKATAGVHALSVIATAYHGHACASIWGDQRDESIRARSR